MSSLVLALYFWVFFAGVGDVSNALLVSDAAAILAGIAFVYSLITYLWVPKKHITVIAFINYLLLVAVVATLVANTYYLASPFIALWILISVFAPIFRWLGVASVLSVVGAFILYLLLNGGISTADLLALGLVAFLPIVIGLIIQSQLVRMNAHKGESAYTELANELSSVEGKSEVVIAAIADGVIALNSEGLVELINPAAQRMIGWGKADALNLNYKSVLQLFNSRDKSPEPENDPINQALTTNELAHSETLSVGTTDTNKKFLASITASPVGTEKNGVIVVFRDITREKAEEREQAEFISTASHEMRTPVASIEGYLGLCLNPSIVQVDDKGRDFITKAQASAQHLGRLFQDLLDVSRVDDGRLNITPKVIDVVKLVHDIAGGLLSRAEQKNLQIDYKPQPDLYGSSSEPGSERTLTPIYYAEVDNDHLREVVANLIENAIKYTLAGSIEIDVTGDNSHITISVKDSGIGIPGADIPHLFQKFYRVDDSDTREIGGTGLGLYLSRKLVESMHGKIWVDSTYQQGSTFYVQLPRLENSKAKEKLEAEQTAQAAASIAPEPSTFQAELPPEVSIKPIVQPSYVQPEPIQPPVATPQPQAPYIAPTVASAPQPMSVAPTRSAPVVVPTPRPTLAEMSPRPLNPAPANGPAALKQRQNIPITTIEANSEYFVRRPTNGPQDAQQ